MMCGMKVLTNTRHHISIPVNRLVSASVLLRIPDKVRCQRDTRPVLVLRQEHAAHALIRDGALVALHPTEVAEALPLRIKELLTENRDVDARTAERLPVDGDIHLAGQYLHWSQQEAMQQ